MSNPPILELVQTKRTKRDLVWLKRSLQSAIELEFFTIPPYLTALWSIKAPRHQVAMAIREVLVEEMLHMSLACNLLKSIGGEPRICDANIVPRYPGHMPGGVKPELQVSLSGLSKQSLETFLKIEEPEEDISFLETAATKETYPRIGSFYDAIEEAFYAINPRISRKGQLEGYFGESQRPDGTNVPKNIGSLEEVSAAIKLIKEQGEGTSELVNDPDTRELAHYYRFKEIAVGRKLIRSEDARWVHQGDEITMPACWPVGVVPKGGYLRSDVPNELWEKLIRFDVIYTYVLKQLEMAWKAGDQGAFHRGIELMMDSLPILARQIMQVQIKNQPYHYAPCFRFAAKEAD